MTVIGRLGVAPEAVTETGDKTLVRYVVGTNHGKGENQKTSWFRVASFVSGPQKDYLLNVPKGSLLYVEADAKMEVYNDAEGNKKSSLSLIASKSYLFGLGRRCTWYGAMANRFVGNFDVLSRARENELDVNDEGLVQEGSR